MKITVKWSILLLLLEQISSNTAYIHGDPSTKELQRKASTTTTTRPPRIESLVSFKDEDRIINKASLIPASIVIGTLPPDLLQEENERARASLMSSVTAAKPAGHTSVMNPIEAWCLSHLDKWYAKSQSVKCPFLRRRWGDSLDTVEKIMKHSVIRKEVWPLMGPPQAWRPAGLNKKTNQKKYKDLPLNDLRNIILQDWKAESGKGYYVTGKLNTAIYRDDCFFAGPDPDMPIQGLRKYVGVAAHLFDTDSSFAALKSLEIVDGDDSNDNETTIVAEWRLRGVIRLPWKPSFPEFSGTTVYHFDKDGLVRLHEEFWDISVGYAFIHTLVPDIAKLIWKSEATEGDEEEETIDSLLHLSSSSKST